MPKSERELSESIETLSKTVERMSKENKKESQKTQLTRNWITMMLYARHHTLDELIKDGCKVMVFGHTYEKFLLILNSMVKDGTILSTNGRYSLDRKGLFEVKRNTIVPLLTLVEDPQYVREFIAKNKENCDYTFVQRLQSQKNENEREKTILSYGIKKYHKLAPLINLVSVFLQHADKIPLG